MRPKPWPRTAGTVAIIAADVANFILEQLGGCGCCDEVDCWRKDVQADDGELWHVLGGMSRFIYYLLELNEGKSIECDQQTPQLTWVVLFN